MSTIVVLLVLSTIVRVFPSEIYTATYRPDVTWTHLPVQPIITILFNYWYSLFITNYVNETHQNNNFGVYSGGFYMEIKNELLKTYKRID